LSTLHTNDAIGAISRLAEMDVPHFLLASTINLIMAQRLVRKICPDCIQSYHLTEQSVDDIAKHYSITDIIAGLIQLGEEVTQTTKLTEINFFHGIGCRKCNDTGYRGRVGIYEVMEMSPRISEGILHSVGDSELLTIAREEGMITMAQDGFVKAKRGLTTIEEIVRVTQE
jgi:type II secretory ATPase GspE/PulE/Tfp pilus assembly ATPase PilB-like protein